MFRECLIQIVTTYTNRKELIQVRLRCKMKFPEKMMSIHDISYVFLYLYRLSLFHANLWRESAFAPCTTIAWLVDLSVSCVVKEILTSTLFNKLNTSSWWGKSHPEFSCTLGSFTCQSVIQSVVGPIFHLPGWYEASSPRVSVSLPMLCSQLYMNMCKLHTVLIKPFDYHSTL